MFFAGLLKLSCRAATTLGVLVAADSTALETKSRTLTIGMPVGEVSSKGSSQ